MNNNILNIYNDIGKKSFFTAGNIQKFVVNKIIKNRMCLP